MEFVGLEMTGFDYKKLSPDVFVTELGEPTSKRGNDWRWGTKGSFSVKIDEAIWFDHETDVGGGVVDFIQRCYPGQPVGQILEEKYGIQKSDQMQLTEYNYGPGKVIREDYPTGKAIRQVGNTKAIQNIPYRYADWCDEKTIIIVEGEKCAEALWERGIPATCNAGGANKWPDGLNDYFKGREVIILPDNDDAGINHAKLVRKQLKQTAKSVKCILLDGLNDKGDVWDWFCNPNNDADKLAALTKGPETTGFGYSVLSVADLEKLPKQEWLVDGLIPKVGVGSIYGAPASFKTFLALHLGLSIASGRSIAERSVQGGKVLYSAHEGFYGIHRRLEPAIQHHSFDANGFHLTHQNKPLDLCDKSEIDALIEDGDNYALIIIDSLVQAMIDVDENSNTEVARALNVAESLAYAKQCCVLLIDHTGKETKGARGASAKLGNQDFSLSIKRHQETDRLSVKVEKQKDGQDNFTVEFQAVEKTITEDFAAIVIEELSEAPKKLSMPDLAKKLLNERQGQTIDELFAAAERYQSQNSLGTLLKHSFYDTVKRSVRNGRLIEKHNKYYCDFASIQSDDTPPSKGGGVVG